MSGRYRHCRCYSVLSRSDVLQARGLSNAFSTHRWLRQELTIAEVQSGSASGSKQDGYSTVW